MFARVTESLAWVVGADVQPKGGLQGEAPVKSAPTSIAPICPRRILGIWEVRPLKERLAEVAEREIGSLEIDALALRLRDVGVLEACAGEAVRL